MYNVLLLTACIFVVFGGTAFIIGLVGAIAEKSWEFALIALGGAVAIIIGISCGNAFEDNEKMIRDREIQECFDEDGIPDVDGATVYCLKDENE